MWPYPRIVAHRGGGKLAPENTLAAMQCGLAHGFHAVEFDVMLSKDGVPVVMHDPDLGRTVAGSGSIADFTVAQLVAMDAGTWFGADFAGEPIPTFEQVVTYCNAHQIWMNIEIKPVPGFEEQTGRIVGEVTQKLFAKEIAAFAPGVNDTSLPLFSSFSFDALMAAKKAAPTIPRGYLVDVIPEDWRERLDTLKAVALHTNQKNLQPEQAQMITEAKFGLFCYTVNEPARGRQILAWGADGFCTDRIDLIVPGFF